MQPECISQKGKQRAFELLMQQKPGFDRYQSGCAGDDEDCGTCRLHAGGNMSFAFSKDVLIAPAKGRGKRTPAWTNRRAKALVPCGFADAKTAKGILQYQNSRKRLSNCPRIPREEVRKYGSFQSGAKYGIYRYEQPPLAKQGIVLKGKGLVRCKCFRCPKIGIIPLRAYPISTGENDAIREAVKELEKAGYIVRSRERDEKGRLRGADYVIYEQPQPKEPEAATSSEQPPTSDLPTLENPTLDNPTLEKPTLENLRWKIQRN